MSKRFENHLGFWCHRAAFAFRTAFEARSRMLGLHYGEAVVLMRIRLDGPQSLAELSRNVGHSHPTVLAQVTSLEDSGYLKREPHSQDRRIKIISLTESGEGIAVQIEKIADEMQDTVSTQFGKQDSSDLIQMLKKLADTIANVDSPTENTRRKDVAATNLPTIKS